MLKHELILNQSHECLNKYNSVLIQMPLIELLVFHKEIFCKVYKSDNY